MTDAGVTGILLAHPTAFSSGELKTLIRVNYFLMLSPSMKFKNHILNFERTDAWTD